MSNLGNYLGAAGFGTLSAVGGYIALEKLLDTANTKAVAIHTQLANAPEVTQQVYDTAKEAAERLSSGDFYSGLFAAAMTGLNGGIAIYFACRKKE
jgi:hypothetical protein